MTELEMMWNSAPTRRMKEIRIKWAFDAESFGAGRWRPDTEKNRAALDAWVKYATEACGPSTNRIAEREA